MAAVLLGRLGATVHVVRILIVHGKSACERIGAAVRRFLFFVSDDLEDVASADGFSAIEAAWEVPLAALVLDVIQKALFACGMPASGDCPLAGMRTIPTREGR